MPDQHTYNSSIFVHVDKFETFVNILTCELSVAEREQLPLLSS